LSYDTLKDFVDIMPLVGQPNVLIVNPGSKLKSLGDFLAEARANPGKINFAFAGIGSGTHLNTEKFKLATRIDVTMVSYKGTAEAIVDVVGGRVDTYFAPISAGLPFIQSGKARALAVTTAKRSSQLPDVPTIAEAGVAGFEFVLWFGLWAPTGTPAPVVNKIWKDFTRALADAGVREKLATLGNETMGMTPAEFRKFVHQEVAEYGRILKAAGIKPQ
jgi:tripartite-type tricarboxylate transporter receptor subunit TctC